jgi:hypothetical protein
MVFIQGFKKKRISIISKNCGGQVIGIETVKI